MPGFDFRSLFTEEPERQLVSGLGASGDWRIKPRSLLDEDADPRFPAFQQAWKQGAGLGDLFGPDPFKLQGTVAPSGGDNTRADVAKVQTLLGKTGHLDLGPNGPSGYANPDTDKAIRDFQKDNGLEVDGVLKPNGPTITKLGGLLGAGASDHPQSTRYPWDEKPGGRDPWDIPGATPPYFPPSKPQSQGGTRRPGDLLSILLGEPPGPTIWTKPELPPASVPAPNPSEESPGGTVSRETPAPQGRPQRQPKLVQGEPTGMISEIPNDPAVYYWYLEYPDGMRVPTSPPPREKSGKMNSPDILMSDDPRTGGITGTLPRPKTIDPFPGHTINQEGIDANQAYAEQLVRDSDPSQTARMLKRAIDDYGDQGRGDLADLLARFQKIDGAKAEDLRREIHKATGEMLPYRLAPLGEGFREPTEEDRIAAAPKTPFGSAEGADRWAAGNMADALLGKGDYTDAITRFRGEIGRDSAETMPYLAAVHQIMDDKNPAAAAKFATQMQTAGLTQTPPDGQQPKSTVRITIRPPAEPEGAPVDVAGPNSGGTGTKKPSDAKYGDDTTPPEWKKDTLNAQGDAWKNFNASVGKLSGVSDNERFVYGQIYAAEGGNAVDPNSGASSGITKQTLEDARNAGAVPGLDKVNSPKDLTSDQRAGIMRWYFDKTMEKAGGSAALDKIDDKLAAGALADSLYRHGSSGGTKLVQMAINQVSGNENLKVDGGMGKDTFDAYSKLVSNPETRDKLLNTLADLRDTATQGREKDRMDHYRPKQ